eukprot:scaffold34026_cov39-Phaeocystis_antarctica.AAC.2
MTLTLTLTLTLTMTQDVAAPGSKVASVLRPAAAAPAFDRGAPRPGEPAADAGPIAVPSRARGLPNGTVLARGGDAVVREARLAEAAAPPTPQDLGPPQGVGPVGGEDGGEAKAAWLAKLAAAPTPAGAGPASAPGAAAAAATSGEDPPWAEELLDLATACNQGVGYACDALQSEDLEKLEWLATRDVVTPGSKVQAALGPAVATARGTAAGRAAPPLVAPPQGAPPQNGPP